MVATGALILAAPASADLTPKDREFLTTLQSIGWKIYDPELLISQAHMVCNEGLAHGVSFEEMRTQLMAWRYSRQDASLFIANAIFAYCPEYDSVVDEIEDDLSAG